MLWWFKTEKKEEILQGRTIKYLAEKILFSTPAYITDVLNGRRSCSYALANHMVRCINKEDINEYFYKKGE